MIEYPKIETLYNRDKETFKVIESEYRRDEFYAVERWVVTEKINDAAIKNCKDNNVTIGGRTD